MWLLACMDSSVTPKTYTGNHLVAVGTTISLDAGDGIRGLERSPAIDPLDGLDRVVYGGKVRAEGEFYPKF